MVMKLFEDDGGSEPGDISKIEINKDFARRYEHNKKREDLQRFEELKKKGVIDDSEEDDESSDDDEDIVNYSTKQDLKFFDALIKVRNKDPSLKNNDAKLFNSDDEEDDENEGGEDKKKKKKPLFLKDVNAKHLLGNGPEFDDEDDEQENKNKKKSYFEEQEEVRKEFLDAVADEDDDGELLKVKDGKGDDDEDEDDHEYEKKLDEYFKEDDKLDENEKFLKEYFRKKMWLEKDKDNSKGSYDVEIDVSEDEEELEKQEDYERGFNFRFEENAGDRVLGHSRKVEGSVRKKENARKVQRENKKQRMAQAEYERNEEVKYLKNLKKKEMNEKLRKIRETAGIGENDGCLLDEHDLEGEFDPEEHDRKMKKAFDDSFYNANDVDPDFGSDEEDGELKKPNFDEEDDLLGLPKGWDDEYGSGDGFLATREKTLKNKVLVNNEEDEEDEEQLQDEEQKRKVSKLEKELINKTLDEYYKLDCEGTIGDLRTRFKYKPVNKNSYGLKAKEILIVDEKELNQIVPLKKLATYREDEFVIPRHKLKEQKQRIKSLIRGEPSDEPTSKRSRHDVGPAETKKSDADAETGKSRSDAANEDPKELSRKQRRKMRLNELKISEKRRMAYEGSTTTKTNKKRKHKSKEAE